MVHACVPPRQRLGGMPSLFQSLKRKQQAAGMQNRTGLSLSLGRKAVKAKTHNATTSHLTQGSILSLCVCYHIKAKWKKSHRYISYNNNTGLSY